MDKKNYQKLSPKTPSKHFSRNCVLWSSHRAWNNNFISFFLLRPQFVIIEKNMFSFIFCLSTSFWFHLVFVFLFWHKMRYTLLRALPPPIRVLLLKIPHRIVNCYCRNPESNSDSAFFDLCYRILCHFHPYFTVYLYFSLW